MTKIKEMACLPLTQELIEAVGEIGARIVNQYRGKQASLFREGLRRSRPTRAQAGVKARELGVRLDWGLGYWEVLG